MQYGFPHCFIWGYRWRSSMNECSLQERKRQSREWDRIWAVIMPKKSRRKTLELKVALTLIFQMKSSEIFLAPFSCQEHEKTAWLKKSLVTIPDLTARTGSETTPSLCLPSGTDRFRSWREIQVCLWGLGATRRRWGTLSCPGPALACTWRWAYWRKSRRGLRGPGVTWSSLQLSGVDGCERKRLCLVRQRSVYFGEQGRL